MPSIRPIQLSDIDAVLAIENSSFSSPFTRDMFESMIGHPPFKGFVAEIGGKITGYLIYSLIVDEADLLTIAVAPRKRKKGYASALMNEMLVSAVADGAKTIILYVRPSNEAALALYSNFGFKKIGIRKKYYKDTGEDAVVMERR